MKCCCTIKTCNTEMLYRKHGGGDFSSTFELMNTVMI